MDSHYRWRLRLDTKRIGTIRRTGNVLMALISTPGQRTQLYPVQQRSVLLARSWAHRNPQTAQLGNTKVFLGICEPGHTCASSTCRYGGAPRFSPKGAVKLLARSMHE